MLDFPTLEDTVVLNTALNEFLPWLPSVTDCKVDV